MVENLRVLIYEDIPAKSLEYYCKMFNEDPRRMDKITMTLEPIPVCAALKDAEYEPIKSVVKELMNSKSKQIEASRF